MQGIKGKIKTRGLRPQVAKAGWREIGGKRHYFRSRYEINYCKYLEWLKKNNLIVEWHYEPKTFWFEGIRRGTVSYKPDFLIEYSDKQQWVEVKGYWDKRSLTKIKRFKKYFPELQLISVDKEWFSKNSRKLMIIVKDWECD
jgi:predicted nuclease of restriction endonuclease-like RecB superfamily